jgi:IclR family transcriptional regulator, acetate operon repressor
MESTVPAYSIHSVDNALKLLLILRRDGVLRISDAATELDVARSTAHRLIAMLRFRGFVEQAADRTYRPGPAFLADGASSTSALAGIARPHLVRLTAHTNETSNMVVRVGPDIKFVDTVESTQSLHVGSRVGVRLSARLTAAGRVLLADLPFDQVVELYPDLSGDSAARAALARKLSGIRREGFAVCLAETERGVGALAMALRGSHGTAVAAVAMAAPTMRFKPTELRSTLPVLASIVAAIRADIIRSAVPERLRRGHSAVNL